MELKKGTLALSSQDHICTMFPDQDRCNHLRSVLDADLTYWSMTPIVFFWNDLSRRLPVNPHIVKLQPVDQSAIQFWTILSKCQST